MFRLMVSHLCYLKKSQTAFAKGSLCLFARYRIQYTLDTVFQSKLCHCNETYLCVLVEVTETGFQILMTLHAQKLHNDANITSYFCVLLQLDGYSSKSIAELPYMNDSLCTSIIVRQSQPFKDMVAFILYGLDLKYTVFPTLSQKKHAYPKLLA